MPTLEEIQQYRLLADYCRRYQEMLMRLPVNVFGGEADKQVGEARSVIHAYIDLCAEEVYLQKHGLVPDKVWEGYCQMLWTRIRSRGVLDLDSVFELDSANDVADEFVAA